MNRIHLPTALVALFSVVLALFANPAFAVDATASTADTGEGTRFSPLHPGAIFCVVVFVVSYIAVLLEEKTRMRKSKPVMVGAAVIWITIAIVAKDYNVPHEDIHHAVMHNLTEYASLLLFLFAAMTYITSMEDRNVFAALRGRLIEARLNMRQVFWVTGILAFFLSPVADNLTTSLVLGAVIMAVGKDDPKFVGLACINVVAAANAGGAFSPFGDITTLMVWQAGKASFFEFFALFLPSVANFLVPSLALSFFIKKDLPPPLSDKIRLKRGAKSVIFLGICTIAMAVCCEQFLGLPPFLGMMAGLSILMMRSYHIRVTGKGKMEDDFHVLDLVKHAEWDTLLFFYGVIFSVGGLGFLGYMELASVTMYDGLGATVTNIMLGVVSAVIDNIPVMFAVLRMDPDMDHFQWLLITLTTGVGGSLLSIGSAAGVALMGVAHGKYTFMGHLRWAPVLLMGYIAAIIVHFLVNGHMIGQELSH